MVTDTVSVILNLRTSDSGESDTNVTEESKGNNPEESETILMIHPNKLLMNLKTKITFRYGISV